MVQLSCLSSLSVCVISPDHWLIVLLILSDYWPAAQTRGWCWAPVFSVMLVTPHHNIKEKSIQYCQPGPWIGWWDLEVIREEGREEEVEKEGW